MSSKTVKEKEKNVGIMRTKKVTSIGDSSRSRPTNKHKRRNFKRYRGQGK